MNPQFKIKCTTCGKTETMSEQQLAESNKIGCAFSRCCNAVATVEQVRAVLHLPPTRAKASRKRR